MTLTDLQSETLDFHADLGGAILRGKFRPRAYTPRVEQLVLGVGDSNSPAAALAEALGLLLVSWNLEDAAGQPYPCTKDALMDVPVAVLGDVFRAIARNLSPKATSAEP